MTRPEDVPGTYERRLHPGGPHEALPLGTGGDIRLHDGSWLGDAQVEEVPDARSPRRRGRLADGDEIDRTELFRFGRPRMRNPDELNEGVARRDLPGERRAVERVA
jgi:hypothetical protein